MWHIHSPYIHHTCFNLHHIAGFTGSGDTRDPSDPPPWRQASHPFDPWAPTGEPKWSLSHLLGLRRTPFSQQKNHQGVLMKPWLFECFNGMKIPSKLVTIYIYKPSNRHVNVLVDSCWIMLSPLFCPKCGAFFGGGNHEWPHLTPRLSRSECWVLEGTSGPPTTWWQTASHAGFVSPFPTFMAHKLVETHETKKKIKTIRNLIQNH